MYFASIYGVWACLIVFQLCRCVCTLDIGRLILSDSVCFVLYFLTYWVLYACFSVLDFSFAWLISLFWCFTYDCALSISYACVFCWILHQYITLHKFVCSILHAWFWLLVLNVWFYIVGFAVWSGHQCVCVCAVFWLNLHTPFCVLVLVSLRNCPADATFLIV